MNFGAGERFSLSRARRHCYRSHCAAAAPRTPGKTLQETLMRRALMRRALIVAALAVLSAGAGVSWAQETAKKKLLVITESKGFVHDVVRRGKDGSLCLVEKTFQDLAKKAGFFDVVVSQDSRKELTAENLKNFDAVWFYTTGTLP